MPRLSWLWLCLLSGLLLTSSARALPDFLELVESVPLETEEHLDDPDIRSTQEVWLEMVEAARESLDMEFFYLRHQAKTGLEPVVQALERAHQRGVKIRVLLDAKFLLTYPELASRWSQLGMEVRTAKFESGVQHTKMMVVDQQQVFLGSQNFDWTSLSHIRELGVHLQQPALAQAYRQAFEHDWRRAVGEQVATRSAIDRQHPVRLAAYGGEVEVYPVFSPAQPEWSHGSSEEEALVELLRSAQKSIELQVMSYSPVVVSHPGDGELPKRYETLDIELRAAAARGVDVKLLVSDWGNRPPHRTALQALATVPHIQVQVSTIPPWSGGEIPYSRVGHSKYLVVDEARGWVGTSNWEYSYFRTSRDMGLVFQGASVAGRLHQFFSRDWDGPYVKSLH